MKRGIPIALQAAGMLLACLVTTLNHPVIATATTAPMHETVLYFNENGVQIYSDTNAAAPGNFIIKTSKTQAEMFPDWEERDTTKKSGAYRTADINGIPKATAKLVEALIRRGSIHDAMVEKNIVPMLDKRSIRKMLFIIKDSCKATKTKRDFREYGGKINRDTTFTFKRGEPTDPQAQENEGLEMKIGERGNYHSHPGGSVEQTKTSSWADAHNPNKVPFSQSSETRIDKFVQGPSYRDQQLIKDKTGYVFGMKSERIYLYNKNGVYATLPFSSLLSKSVNK